MKKSLLSCNRGKWEDENDEVVALEREGGKDSESQGMPVLSVVKELDADWLDFVVAAWCVTLWGEVGKRARRLSRNEGGKGEGSKFSFAGFGKGKSCVVRWLCVWEGWGSWIGFEIGYLFMIFIVFGKSWYWVRVMEQASCKQNSSGNLA